MLNKIKGLALEILAAAWTNPKKSLFLLVFIFLQLIDYFWPFAIDYSFTVILFFFITICFFYKNSRLFIKKLLILGTILGILNILVDTSIFMRDSTLIIKKIKEADENRENHLKNTTNFYIADEIVRNETATLGKLAGIYASEYLYFTLSRGNIFMTIDTLSTVIEKNIKVL